MSEPRRGLALTSMAEAGAEEIFVFPASFAQQRLWFLDRLEPGSPRYNIPLALRLAGPLDTDALRQALAALTRRHEVLRTTFAEGEDGPVQVVRPDLLPALVVEDLGPAGSSGVRDKAVAERARAEGRRPFDLETGPLLRARLLRLGPEEHVALLTLHHIIADGWSMGVLVREMTALYQAFRTGAPAPLPPLPLQYADYAIWQREWLAGERLERQLDYWRDRLAGAAPLELPSDRPRPPVATFRGDSIPRRLSSTLTTRLEELGRGEGATLFMVLLAAWQLLLARYSGQDDISVGTPIANRRRGELEPLIGFFVNTLVLRTDVAGAPTFRDLLRRVKQGALEAYAHQDVPFEQVVEAVRPERRLSHTPLFQVMFAFQNATVPEIGLPGLSITQLPVKTGLARFDLNLTVSAVGEGGLSCLLEYDADLFDRESIERLLDHFQVLLDGVVARPDEPIGGLPLLATDEEAELEAWAGPVAPPPAEKMFHELIASQAARTPDGEAVRFEGRGMSYRELDRRSNRLARHLRSRGVGPEVLVGLCVERSPDLVVGVLGVLKAGGAYLPLDPAYPAERLRFMMEDAGIDLVLTQAALVDRLPTEGIEALCLDRDAGLWAEEPDTPFESGAGPDTLAYVIYTSGSTGRPKGVEIEHHGVANLAGLLRRRLELGPGDRVLQFSALSFDVSVWEMAMALGSGATLVLAPAARLMDVAELGRVLTEEGVTVMTLPPSVLVLLEPEGFGRLRIVFSAGEACPASLVTKWAPGRRFFNAYGPTEITVCASWSECGPETIGPPPIGTALDNERLYVLDAARQRVPVGVPGELWVGGVGVGRGYRGRPELTAERFLEDPFGIAPGARVYRTGDRVRWRRDGQVEYLGRFDEQVKLRGFRIELGEIETALQESADVRAAVVVMRDDGAGPRLVAYVVLDAGAPVDPGALRDRLRARLPDYMVPAAFVGLDALPLQPNGKVDRRGLPAPEPETRVSTEYVPPRTATEAVLVDLFQDVLAIRPVSARDSFFELGGHSLLATQLMSRVRRAFEIELPLRALFESPTVAELGARVDDALRSGAAPLAPPIGPAPRDGDDLPLSFAQQRLWFLDRLDPGNAAYNIPEAVRLRGALDVAGLEASLNHVVARHEVLRTCFMEKAGVPVQRILPHLRIPLAVEDLSDAPAERREEEVSRRAGEEARRVFDLSRPPLLRAHLLRLGAEEHVLLLTVHHIVSDGWSSGVLVGELTALYGARQNGEPAGLAPLPLQYGDYALWQRGWLQGPVLDAELAYWKERLGGAPPLLELPTDRPRPPVQTFPGDYVTARLPAGLTDRLRELGRREGATLFMTLLAAWQVLLGRLAGQEDVCVGTPVANRTQAELEGLIGFFVNTLVLRTRLSGGPDFVTVLRRVKAAALGAYGHQEVPFEQVVDAVRPERDLAHSPLFQAMFVFQNRTPPPDATGGVSLERLPTGTGTAKFDVTLFAAEEADGLACALEYNTDLFDRETAERWLSHLTVLLEGVAADPERPVAKIPLLSEAERRQVTLDWNRTAGPFPRDACVHHLFERQARRRPAAIAVRPADGAPVTYGELDARANRLARHLQALGAGPETVVGLCLWRSALLVEAVLAVLKSGAAYLPVDPGYPEARMAYMLADAGVEVVVAEDATADCLGRLAGRVVRVDRDRSSWASRSGEAVDAAATPSSLAYVIYTSGSTGRPKGVEIEHQGVVNYLTWCERAYPLGPGHVVPVHSSVAFDLTITSLLAPLAAGGTVAPVPEAWGVEGLGRLLRDQSCGAVKLTPAHMTLLVEQLGEDLAGAARTLVIGGEALTRDVVDAWRDRAPDTELLNEYGPTETVVGCSVERVGAEPGGASVPIGRPILNMRVYVLDAHREPVPVGVVGELWVAGVQVARGYRGLPELTAERFTDDPFVPGERMYRTGDRGRWLRDGRLEFLGRTDEQVKVRGFRVEPGEVEAALRDVPGVRDAAVALQGDGPAPRLVGYVVPAPGEIVDPAQVRERIARRLPDYMVPADLVELETLPLTAHGKVDRRALPAPEIPAPAATGEAEPRTDVERTLAALWTDLLGTGPVGRHAHFFQMGGDSILSLQLVARAREQGLSFRVRDVFEAPTLAALALRAEAAGRLENEPAAPRGAIEGAYPLAPIQRWLLRQDVPDRSWWNQSVLLRVRIPLDRAALETALTAVLARHDALRLRFETDPDGAWRQRYSEETAARVLDWHDLRGQDPEARRAALEAGCRAAQQGLDLAAGPVFRVVAWSLAEESRLLVVAHHLVTDAVSWRLVLGDLVRAHEQAAAGSEVRLGGKTTAYGAWAGRLVGDREAAEGERDYWSAVIGHGGVRLPIADAPDPEEGARSVGVALSAEETAALVDGVRTAWRAELQEALLAAVGVAVGEWTGEREVVLDVEGHGRDEVWPDVDVSATAGWFTALYPVRLAGAGTGAGAAVRQAKEALRGVPRGGHGWGVLREVLGEMASVRSPDVAVNFLGRMDAGHGEVTGAIAEAAAGEAGPERDPRGRRPHAVEVLAAVRDGALRIEWVHGAARIDRTTMQGVAGRGLDLLRAMAREAAAPEAAAPTPSDFPLAGLDRKALERVLSKAATD